VSLRHDRLNASSFRGRHDGPRGASVCW
jgi:hypothetical protein